MTTVVKFVSVLACCTPTSGSGLKTGKNRIIGKRDDAAEQSRPCGKALRSVRFAHIHRKLAARGIVIERGGEKVNNSRSRVGMELVASKPEEMKSPVQFAQVAESTGGDFR